MSAKKEIYGALKARVKDIDRVLNDLSELSGHTSLMSPEDTPGNSIQKLRDASIQLVSFVHEFNAYYNAYHSILKGEGE